MKKLLSLLLAAALLLGASCFAPVFAEEDGDFTPPAPENPVWDDTVARWDRFLPPEELTSIQEYSRYYYYGFYYTVELFRVAEDNTAASLGVFSTFTSVQYDFAQLIMKNGYGRYYFTVKCSHGEKLISEPAQSAVKEFTAENMPKVPLPSPTFDGWTINYLGQAIANWNLPTDKLPSDVDYTVRLNLYKDDALAREYDLGKYQTSYTFSDSEDEIPTDSESKYTVGVKLIPVESETRYAESREYKTSNYVLPAELLTRRIYDVSPEPCRAGAEKITFIASWSGAYGTVKSLFVKLFITSADGTETETTDGIRWNLNYVQGSGYRFNYDNYLNYTFKAGDVVEWQLAIGASYPSSLYDVATGTFTVEESVPHTVILDAQGFGENTEVTVPDCAYLSDVENVRSLYPVTPGYAIIGFSKEKKPMDEYVYEDLFSGKITEDLTLYAVLKPVIDTVELNAEAPVCGTTVKLKRVLEEDGYYYYVMQPAPGVSVPESAPYELYSENLWWYHTVTPEPTEEDPAPEPTAEPFLGKIAGGEEYAVSFEIEMKRNENRSIDLGLAAADQLKITGDFTSAEAQYSYTGTNYAYAYFRVTVTAVHDWSAWRQTVAPENGKNGQEERVCAGCGKTETRELTHAHTLTKVESKPATCVAPGNKEYYTCGICHRLFSDASGQTEITAESVAVTDPGPGGGHAWGAWTRQDDTLHRRVCANDPAHVETANHTWDAGSVTKAATAAAAGEKTYTCAVCRGTKTESIPKLAFLLGDVDRNGSVTAADARLALRRAVKLETYAEDSVEFMALDINRNGKAEASDARSILRAAVKLEVLR